MKNAPYAEDQTKFHSEIRVKVTGFLLTPLTCASIINEIFKNLLYQKSQLPYTYNWLKTIVDRKRQKVEPLSNQVENKPNNFKIINHFRAASSTYDAINNVTSSILNELRSSRKLMEVVFLFGVTPFSPKEVFTIRISSLALGHSDTHHEAENSRKQHKVLREIFLSDNWINSVENSLTCTNVFVYLRTKGGSDSESSINHSDIFLPTKPLILNPKVKHTLIHLDYDDTQIQPCCGNFRVFKDTNPSSNNSCGPLNDVKNVIENDNELWSQSKFLIQGFKDCFINKVPACELW